MVLIDVTTSTFIMLCLKVFCQHLLCSHIMRTSIGNVKLLKPPVLISGYLNIKILPHFDFLQNTVGDICSHCDPHLKLSTMMSCIWLKNCLCKLLHSLSCSSRCVLPAVGLVSKAEVIDQICPGVFVECFINTLVF